MGGRKGLVDTYGLYVLGQINDHISIIIII